MFAMISHRNCVLKVKNGERARPVDEECQVSGCEPVSESGASRPFQRRVLVAHPWVTLWSVRSRVFELPVRRSSGDRWLSWSDPADVWGAVAGVRADRVPIANWARQADRDVGKIMGRDLSILPTEALSGLGIGFVSEGRRLCRYLVVRPAGRDARLPSATCAAVLCQRRYSCSMCRHALFATSVGIFHRSRRNGQHHSGL